MPQASPARDEQITPVKCATIRMLARQQCTSPYAGGPHEPRSPVVAHRGRLHSLPAAAYERFKRVPRGGLRCVCCVSARRARAIEMEQQLASVITGVSGSNVEHNNLSPRLGLTLKCTPRKSLNPHSHALANVPSTTRKWCNPLKHHDAPCKPAVDSIRVLQGAVGTEPRPSRRLAYPV